MHGCVLVGHVEQPAVYNGERWHSYLFIIRHVWLLKYQELKSTLVFDEEFPQRIICVKAKSASR